MNLIPDGSRAVSIVESNGSRVQGCPAIPAYLVDASYPRLGNRPVNVRIVTDQEIADGKFRLEGRPYALPVFYEESNLLPEGNVSIPIYIVNPVTSFSPSSISGLQLWLKADEGCFKDAAKTQPCVSDSDAIWTWADQSGNGNDCVKSTLTPFYKVNIQNGRPGVLFGSNRWFTLTSSLTPSTVTCLAVVRATGTTGNRGIIGGGDGSLAWQVDPTTNVISVRSQPSSIIGTSNTGIGTSTSLIAFTYSSPDLALRLNGSPDGVASVASTFEITFYVGKGSAVMVGYIMELLVYDTVVSPTNLGLLESYLNDRWGVYS